MLCWGLIWREALNGNEMGRSVGVLGVVGVHVILECFLWYLKSINEDVTVIRKTGKAKWYHVSVCYGMFWG